MLCRRMPLSMAALRSILRPNGRCFAHTAILELPRSTMLEAGWENCGDSLDVIRKRRNLLFFLCRHECSPSTSETNRPRFHDLTEGGDGGENGDGNSARGDILKVNFVLDMFGKVKSGRIDGEDADTEDGIIPRRASSFVGCGL